MRKTHRFHFYQFFVKKFNRWLIDFDMGSNPSYKDRQKEFPIEWHSLYLNRRRWWLDFRILAYGIDEWYDREHGLTFGAWYNTFLHTK